jgi:hypothetical protein
MKPIYHYTTVSKAVDELSELRFTYDYNIYQADIIINSAERKVKLVYRYEGNSDPYDLAKVYLIASSDFQKGVFIAGFPAKKNEAVLVLSKLCIENSNHECRT